MEVQILSWAPEFTSHKIYYLPLSMWTHIQENILCTLMHTLKPLPENHEQMDGHHMHTFRHNLPWWIRPIQSRSEYSIPDFVGDVRGRITKVIDRSDSAMGRIWKERKILPQTFSYRIARDSANIVKTGYSQDDFLQFMKETLGVMKRCQRYGIPSGDPLFGKYGVCSKEHSSGQPIYLNDLTSSEKQLVNWLLEGSRFRDLMHNEEFAHYTSRSPETHFVLFSPDFRKKMWGVLDGVVTDDESWRKKCVNLAVDELFKIGGVTQQSRANELTKDLAYDPLTVDPRKAMNDVIQPNISNAEKKDACFALMEQLMAVAATEHNLENLRAVIDVWNTLMGIHNIASCERPTGGLAAVIAKCAGDSANEVQRWLGPQPAVAKK